MMPHMKRSPSTPTGTKSDEDDDLCLLGQFIGGLVQRGMYTFWVAKERSDVEGCVAIAALI
jgi:hypothetical protein